MPEKVKIPIELFNKIIDLLESLDDVEDFPPETLQLFGYVLYALKHKKISIARQEMFLQCFDEDHGRLRFSKNMVNALMYGDDVPF
jgi:hypothetical protein